MPLRSVPCLQLALSLALGVVAIGADRLPQPRLVADLAPGSDGSYPGSFIEWNGRLWFQATFLAGESSRLVLYSTEGIPSGTRRVKELGTDKDGPNFGGPFIAGKRLCFLSRHEVPRWRRIWCTDGTGKGTRPLSPAELYVCPEFRPVPMGDRLVAFVHGDYEGHGIVALDLKTEASEVLAAPLDMWLDYNEPPLKLGTDLLLPDGEGRQFWRIPQHGHDLARFSLPGLLRVATDDGIRQFASLAGVIVMLPGGANPPLDLWRTDGTPAGTAKVGSLSSIARPEKASLTAASTHVFLTAYDSNHACAVLCTDGSTDGTRLLLNLQPYKDAAFSLRKSHLPDPLVSGEILYFMADDGAHGLELWRTDGTKEGTRIVSDTTPGPHGTDVRRLVSVGDGRVLLFCGDRGLWLADGDPEVTTMLMSAEDVSSIRDYYVSQDRFFFGAERDPATGHELWVLDLPAKSMR